jgi:acyl-coenzyme A thioesterase PaaI-like protein
MTASDAEALRRHDLNIWLGRDDERGPHHSPSFARLADAVRLLQDRFTAAGPGPEEADALAVQVEELARTLSRHEVAEADQAAGRQYGAFARGQTFLPGIRIDEYDGDSVLGRVSFDRFYLGSNGAAHGGAISLLFDDLLGQLANAGRPRARTAYLHVEYRRVVPIETELVVQAGTTRVEGRKVYIDGTLRDGPVVLAEASGLFVRLRPDQP